MLNNDLLNGFKADLEKANTAVKESTKVAVDNSLKEEVTEIKMLRVIEGKPSVAPTTVSFDSYMESTVSLFKSAANQKGLSNVNIESLGFVGLFKLPDSVELVEGIDRDKKIYAYFKDDANAQRVIRAINKIVEQNTDKTRLKIKMEQEHTIELSLINSKGKAIKRSMLVKSLFATDSDLSAIANLDYVKSCTLWSTDKGTYVQVDYDIEKFNAIPR